MKEAYGLGFSLGQYLLNSSISKLFPKSTYHTFIIVYKNLRIKGSEKYKEIDHQYLTIINR